LILILSYDIISLSVHRFYVYIGSRVRIPHRDATVINKRPLLCHWSCIFQIGKAWSAGKSSILSDFKSGYIYVPYAIVSFSHNKDLVFRSQKL